MAHLDLGAGQCLARRNNRRAQTLLTHGTTMESYWIPGHPGIPGNQEAVRQATIAPDGQGRTTIEQQFTSALNRARCISEGRSAAKAQWEAEKCSKHFSYRLKSTAGNRRPIPMAREKSLPTRFDQLKCRHASTVAHLKRFVH